MAAIQFSAMKTRVRKNLNNLPADHVIWVEYGLGGDFVNEGANRLILHSVSMDRRAANCFPELQNRRWSDTTVANQNYLALPDNLLVLESATYTKLTTTYDPSAQTEYPMVEMPNPELFAFLVKTAKGWPQLWRRAGKRFEYWPTTSSSPTDYRTKVVLRGLRKEDALTSDSQTFEMSDLWHPTIVKCATAIAADQLGRTEVAKEWWGQVDRDVTATLNLLGLERINDNVRVEIAGMPR